MSPGFTARDLATRVGGRVEGDPAVSLSAVKPIEEAGPGDLAFLGNAKYRRAAAGCRAGALLTSPRLAPEFPVLILVENPYEALADLIGLFHPAPAPRRGVSDRAVVASDARLGKDVWVGPLAVIGSRCRVGDRAQVHAGVVLGEDCVVGEDSVLHPRVVAYPGTILGRRVQVHAGAVLGSDGYGYATSGGRHRKVPQVGVLVIEDDVEIGANTTVDRGSLGRTVIGRGTKIDNLVQVGHNVRIGEDSLIVAQAGISGSTRIGRGTVFAGQSGAVGHIRIGDGVTVAGKSVACEDLPDGSFVAGFPAIDHRLWKRAQAVFARLPGLRSELRSLLARVEELERRLGGKG